MPSKLVIIILAIILSASAAVPAVGGPLRLTITDLDTLELQQASFGFFARELGDKINREIAFLPFKSRTGAVSALKAKRIDLVLTGPAEYVVFPQADPSQTHCGLFPAGLPRRHNGPGRGGGRAA